MKKPTMKDYQSVLVEHKKRKSGEQTEIASEPKAASTSQESADKAELPKAVVECPPEGAADRSDWRFADSPEVQRRLEMGWRLIGERCISNGVYFYSEPVGWKWEEKSDE